MYSKIRNFANYPENPPGGASGTEASFRVSMGGIQIPTFLALLLLLDGSLAFWLGSRGTRVVNPLRKAAGAAEGQWRPAPRFAGGELILTEENVEVVLEEVRARSLRCSPCTRTRTVRPW